MMGSSDTLDRFVTAQEPVMAEVRTELAAGRKTSHWMWFVFPQLRGLGHSAMALHYGLASLEEARAYLGHPILGSRLKECVELVLAHSTRTPYEIFGAPDDAKFRSSMTLFHLADPAEPLFLEAIDLFYGGALDNLTVSQTGN